MTSEEVRLACLQQAVSLCINRPSEGQSPVELAKQFAGFVFGFEWDEDEGEFVEPDADDTSLAAVRAFNDEGEEL